MITAQTLVPHPNLHALCGSTLANTQKPGLSVSGLTSGTRGITLLDLVSSEFWNLSQVEFAMCDEGVKESFI